jgi:hypothetical protein
MSAKSNRNKGRQAEFFARELISRALSIHPSEVLLRSKGANGCDVWCSSFGKKHFPFSVEVKNCARIPFYKVTTQMNSNIEPDTYPVAFTLNEALGHYAILRLEDFMGMVKCLEENNLMSKFVSLQITRKIKDARCNFSLEDNK